MFCCCCFKHVSRPCSFFISLPCISHFEMQKRILFEWHQLLQSPQVCTINMNDNSNCPVHWSVISKIGWNASFPLADNKTENEKSWRFRSFYLSQYLEMIYIHIGMCKATQNTSNGKPTILTFRKM